GDCVDAFWRRKYPEDEEGGAVRRPEADQAIADVGEIGHNPPAAIHLPNPSYFPFLVGLAITIISYGIIYHTSAWGKALIVGGVLLTLISFIGWGIEPLEDEPDDAAPGNLQPAEAH